MTHSTHPIVIVGGGFSGPLMALALGAQYGPVHVVDPAPLDYQLAAPSDGRAIAITAASKKLFDKLNLWPLLAPQAQPLYTVITQEPTGIEMRMSAEETAGEPLGYMVDSKVLKDTLVREIHKKEYITCLTDQVMHLEYLAPFQSAIALHFASGNVQLATLVIGADGAQSRLRRAANLRSYQWSYEQTAFVRIYQHTNLHHGQAYEKFLETGPFAILPLPENRSSIVWAVPPRQANTLRSLSDHDFDQAVFPHMKEYRGLTPYSPRWERPLNGLWVPFFTTHRLALIGDAAHQIHPLAGQGLNLGIYDVEALEETLAEGVSLGLDIGSQTLLKRYEQKQRWQHLTFLGATHGLNRLFSNDDAVLKWLRTRGLAFVENTPSLKQFFAYKGSGRPFKVPHPVP